MRLNNFSCWRATLYLYLWIVCSCLLPIFLLDVFFPSLLKISLYNNNINTLWSILRNFVCHLCFELLMFMFFCIKFYSSFLLLHQYVESQSPFPSCRWKIMYVSSGITLYFIFRFLIHLEFIFVYDVSYGSDFIFFQMAKQLSQSHLLKSPSLLWWSKMTSLYYSSRYSWIYF